MAQGPTDTSFLSIEWGYAESAWTAALYMTHGQPAMHTYTFKNQAQIDQLGQKMASNDHNALHNALPAIFQGNTPPANIYNQLFQTTRKIFLQRQGQQGRWFTSKTGTIEGDLGNAGRFLQGATPSQAE